MKKYLFFTMLLSFISICFYAQADQSTDFPSQISFEHGGKKYQLEQTGVATRKKFMVKVYNLASYLENGVVTDKANAFDQILQDNKAKQVTIKWLHEASVDKVQEGYQDSFKKVISSDDYTKLQKEIDTYIGFFNAEVKVGDEQVIRWLPGGYVEVIINGATVGNVTNVAFAKALFSIWFGPKSIFKREDLISKIK